MTLLKIGEVFGNDTALPHKADKRNRPYCPFRESACTKQGIKNPLGICSFTDGEQATVVCPSRFLESSRLIVDAARLAFGINKRIIAVPEYRLLEVSEGKRERKKKIGKIDFLIALLDSESKAIDFAALEIQAVYISGHSIRPVFENYLATGKLREDGLRRPDYRSSAQKRLMPQLALKVPVFRRWGKRFFVAVDKTLFETLPELRPQSPDNSEVTWLVYEFKQEVGKGFVMQEPNVIHTLWDDVVNSLREGKPPERSELLSELTMQAARRKQYKT